MNLLSILYGNYTPPNIPSRPHRIGLSGGQPYTPPKPRPIPQNTRSLNPSKYIVFEAVEKNGHPVSASELAKIVKMTRNHCSITMCSLFKEGLLKRYKKNQNGTSFYVYSIKDKK